MYFQHHRFQIWGQPQHPYRHSLAEFTYVNAALPTDQPQNAESAMNWLFAVIYPQTQTSVATPAALPAGGNTINDYRVVTDDGDGKAAAYRWEQREGDPAAKWYKIYDMDWGEQSILSNFLLKTQDVYVYKHGIDDLDDTGSALAGDDAGQSVYGGATAGSHLTLYANSGDGLGAGTGYVQIGDNSRPKVDNTYSSGTATYRWAHTYAVLATIGTMDLAGGSITDSSGAISFADENLTTSGTITSGTLTISGGSITDTSGAISFGNENLTTTGTGTFDSVSALGASSSFATGTTIGSLTLSNGSITDSSGTISFDNENLTTTGTLTAGFLTIDNITIDANTITTTSGNLILSAAGAGVVNVADTLDVTSDVFVGSDLYVGTLTTGIQITTGAIKTLTTNLNLRLQPNGTGIIEAYASVRPNSAVTADLGAAGSSRWQTLYISTSISDGVTAITSGTLQSFRDASTGASNGDALFWDTATSRWLPSAPDSEISHGNLADLTTADDHTQYAYLAGRSGGQLLIGGSDASDNLTLESTSNATKGNIILRDTTVPSSDLGIDLGTASLRIDDLYMGGEGIGFRMQNVATFASLPAPSALNKGRLAWVDDIDALYVDDGGVWVIASNTLATAVWTKFTISYTFFAAAATTQDKELFLLLGNEVIEGVSIVHTAEFLGGGASSYDISIGLVGNLTQITSLWDVFAPTDQSYIQDTNVLDRVNTAARSIRLQAISDVNLNTLTQGSVDIFVKIGTLP